MTLSVRQQMVVNYRENTGAKCWEPMAASSANAWRSLYIETLIQSGAITVEWFADDCSYEPYLGDCAYPEYWVAEDDTGAYIDSLGGCCGYDTEEERLRCVVDHIDVTIPAYSHYLHEICRKTLALD